MGGAELREEEEGGREKSRDELEGGVELRMPICRRFRNWDERCRRRVGVIRPLQRRLAQNTPPPIHPSLPPYRSIRSTTLTPVLRKEPIHRIPLHPSQSRRRPRGERTLARQPRRSGG